MLWFSRKGLSWKSDESLRQARRKLAEDADRTRERERRKKTGSSEVSAVNHFRKLRTLGAILFGASRVRAVSFLGRFLNCFPWRQVQAMGVSSIGGGGMLQLEQSGGGGGGGSRKQSGKRAGKQKRSTELG